MAITENAGMFRVWSAGVVPEDEGKPSRTFGNDGHLWLIAPAGPTRIEAENFDQGGPNVAYHDADYVNQGSAYRNEDVDIQPTTDTGGGFNVAWIESGEWLEYTIDVPAAGKMILQLEAWNVRERDEWGRSAVLRRNGEEPERWHWVDTGTCFRLDHWGKTAGGRPVIRERGLVATCQGIDAPDPPLRSSAFACLSALWERGCPRHPRPDLATRVRLRDSGRTATGGRGGHAGQGSVLPS